MTTLLRLNHVSRACLQAQVHLNGTFHHTLIGIDGKTTLRAAVTIEQCGKGIDVTVQSSGLRHSTSVVLDKRRADTAARVIQFVESITNGDTFADAPDFEEYALVSDMERDLRRAIRMGRGTFWLSADELEPILQIARTRHGYTARIDLDDAQCYLTLPADSQRAYDMLADNMNRFLQGHRDSLAAAA